MKIRYKLVNWLWSTWIGDLYFKFLVWKDTQANSDARYLTPGEAATIIREYSLLSEGVTKVKKTVNKLVQSKSKEEYHKVLKELEDMVSLATSSEDEDPSRTQFARVIKEIAVKKGNQDVVTPQDKLNMINKRIKDYKELHSHQAKRNLMRQIRKARQENNLELLSELELQFKEQYGKGH